MRPVHPGEVLREEMEERGLSANALSQDLGVPANRITGILNEERAVTPDTALRLARYFGMSAAFWLNLQQAYDLRTAEATVGREIERRVRPVDAARARAAAPPIAAKKAARRKPAGRGRRRPSARRGSGRATTA